MKVSLSADVELSIRRKMVCMCLKYGNLCYMVLGMYHNRCKWWAELPPSYLLCCDAADLTRMSICSPRTRILPRMIALPRGCGSGMWFQLLWALVRPSLVRWQIEKISMYSQPTLDEMRRSSCNASAVVIGWETDPSKARCGWAKIDESCPFGFLISWLKSSLLSF